MKVFEIHLACILLIFLTPYILHIVSSEKDSLTSIQCLSIQGNKSFEPGAFSRRKLYTQSSKQC